MVIVQNGLVNISSVYAFMVKGNRDVLPAMEAKYANIKSERRAV